ncbi:spore protein [Mucilaginibacter antarcticus]|uniref:spore protein n=1 Tax=Mucilaginibacter antarcticus TaxID=1855725 RepID=UPI00364484E8
MGVTRLKRKDRRNKTFSRLEVQFLKNATNLEAGSRSAESPRSQVTINNIALAKLLLQTTNLSIDCDFINPAGLPAGYFV